MESNDMMTEEMIASSPLLLFLGGYEMKKRGCVILGIAIAAVALMGCGSEEADYSKYVTLGDYKNITVTKQVEEVTEESLAAYEKEQLADYAEYEEVEGPIENGQSVDVSLLAKAGEEIVYDFSEEGYELMIGEAEFGTQVDEQLLGKNLEDTLDFDVSYETGFEDSLLAGRAITYHIEINSISKVIYPELTDTFVQENMDADSVADWESSLRSELQETNEEEAEETYRANLVQAAVDTCEIEGYPKSLYEQKKEETEAGYQSYADMFDITAEELYETIGIGEEEREQEYIDAVNETMVLAEIRKAEGLTLSDEKLQKLKADMAEEYEYDSVEELCEDYGEDDLQTYFLDEATIDFLEKCAQASES